MPGKTEKIKEYPSKKAVNFFNAIWSTGVIETKKGNTLSKKEDEIRKYILKEFPKLNRAPTVEEISKAFNFSSDETVDVLKKLNALDIIYMDEKTSRILGAYPFSNIETPYRVSIKGIGGAYAMCAIDALGVSPMFKREVDIESSCAYCKKEVRIKVKENEILSYDPEETRVLIGQKRSKCAATSICPMILFLCSKDHVSIWKSEKGELIGEDFDLQDALFIGKGIFEDFLK